MTLNNNEVVKDLAIKVLRSNYDYDHTGLPEMTDAEWDNACVYLSDHWDEIPVEYQRMLGDKHTIRYTGSGMKWK